MQKSECWYSVFEVAKILGVSPETIRRYIREEKLQAKKERVVGLRKEWVISKNALENFAKNQSITLQFIHNTAN